MGRIRFRCAVGLAALSAAAFLGSGQSAQAKGKFTQGVETAIDQLVDLIGMGVDDGMPAGKIHGLDNALQQLLRVLENKGKHHHHHGHFGKGMDMGGGGETGMGKGGHHGKGVGGQQNGAQDPNQQANQQRGQGGQFGKGMKQAAKQGCCCDPNQQAKQGGNAKAGPGGDIAGGVRQPWGKNAGANKGTTGAANLGNVKSGPAGAHNAMNKNAGTEQHAMPTLPAPRKARAARLPPITP